MKGEERERKLSMEYYHSDNYFSYDRLWSYSEQIQHIMRMQPRNLIEIGVGNGFVSEFLRKTGIDVKTFDINPDLQPDVVAPVQEVGDFIEPGEYDLISCCEVLEHLPFEEFEPIVREFSCLAERLFLTLPVFGTRRIGFGGLVQLPGFSRWLGLWLRLPKRRQPLPDMHFWEIDYSKQTRKERIMQILRKHYRDVETGLFKANPYHRYFKCAGSTYLGEI